MAMQAQQTGRREIEVFSAGCTICQREIDRILTIAAAAQIPVQVHDMHSASVAERAQGLGVVTVPAIVITTHGAPGTPPTSRLATGYTPLGIDGALLRDEMRALPPDRPSEGARGTVPDQAPDAPTGSSFGGSAQADALFLNDRITFALHLLPHV